LTRPKLIFSDFDGTLTLGSELGPVFFEITSLAHQAKTPFIIVTGRSVQWSYFTLIHVSCLQYSIAEGGGLWVEKKGPEELETHFLVTADERVKLAEFASALTKKFGFALTADSSGRLTDRALDLSLFHKNPTLQNEVQSFMKEESINFSTSSVHLNFWVGNISKARAMTEIIKQRFPDVSNDELVYFGDSLNDETVFAHFPNTIGVSNISAVWDKLKSHPSLRLMGAENQGPLGVKAQLASLLK